jgi:coenzyme F420-reducing hydrogenase alpha subunit
MSTPKAQAALEEFREAFGRPAQATLLYHYARLIELIYACERTIELLNWEGITDTNVRAKVEPGAGRGVGIVEAPRGTLIHDYTTDSQGLHNEGQSDRWHHPQYRADEYECQTGGDLTDQGRQYTTRVS